MLNLYQKSIKGMYLPGGAVNKDPAAHAGGTGWIPGLGRIHIQLSLCAAMSEAATIRSPCTTAQSSPCSRNQTKPSSSNEDPVQPKINELIN